MCKVILATGCIVGYAYTVEFFTAFFSGNPYERFTFLNRATGPYALGGLDNVYLQRDFASVVLVQKNPPPA